VRGEGDGIIVGTVHDCDGCALGGNGVDAGGDGACGDEDARLEAKEPGHAGDGASVVPVGGGGERERPKGLELRYEIVERVPLGLEAEEVDNGTVGRPGGAQDLEGGEAEAA
jgi:hypothetical protein